MLTQIAQSFKDKDSKHLVIAIWYNIAFSFTRERKVDDIGICHVDDCKASGLIFKI